MSNLLTQLVLAQRSKDDGGWTNLLFFVVVAVVYVLGALVKAMKAKSGDGQQQPMPLGKPPAHGRGVQRQMPVQAQRPAGPSQRPEQPPGPQQKRTTLGDLRAAARKFAAEAEQAFQSQTTKLTPKPTMPAPEPKAQPDMAPIIEPTAAPFKGRAYKQAATAEMPPTQQLSDLLADYSDPEKLRKAILHYEILGPPVSLRD